MENQPRINIGVLGKVADGKSTLVKVLSETSTQRYSNERERNITIKLGYANCKIFSNNTKNIITNEQLNVLDYESTSGKKKIVLDDNQNEKKMVEHLSFIDCPGHQELILTMMSGISIMDYVIFVIAVDEPIRNKQQFMEHFNAAIESDIKKCIFILNKVDLVKKEILNERFNELKNLISDTKFNMSPIIPTSLNCGYNKEYILYYIVNWFNDKIVNIDTDDKYFRITRSFDINKSEILWTDIQGGVVGGSVVKGRFNLNEVVYLYPGIWKKVNNENGNPTFKVVPLETTIENIRTEDTELQYANIGGLIALKTTIDPFYVKNDKLIGNLITNNKLEYDFQIVIELEIISYQNDFRNYSFDVNDKKDSVTITIASHNIKSSVILQNKNIIKVELTEPVLILDDDIIIISKKINQVSKIIGKCTKI